ncbi:hypothetical protein D3C84_1047920 [compost metagenome]
MLWRTISTPSTDIWNNALACSRPSFLRIAPDPSAQPGETTPPFRPDAPQATCWASRMITRLPRRVSSRAAVRPAIPAPMMQTSQLSSAFNSDLAARGSEVWEYQVLGKDMVNP